MRPFAEVFGIIFVMLVTIIVAKALEYFWYWLLASEDAQIATVVSSVFCALAAIVALLSTLE